MSHAPAQIRFYAILRKHLATTGVEPGDMLPPVSNLVALTGIARATAQKVLARLSAAGLVEGHRGVGTTLLAPLPPSPPVSRPGPARDARWRRLALHIRADIAHGALGPSLPSVKTLQSQYGACFRTVQRALTNLADEGVLVIHRRGYRVRQPRGMGSANEVYLVTIGDAQGLYGIGTPLRTELLRQIEYRCMERNLRLRVFVYSFRLGTVVRNRELMRTLAVKRGKSTALGTIVLPFMLHTEHLTEIADGCARLGRPLAVLDETGSIDPTRHFPHSPRCFHFTVSNSQAPGRTAARFLLAQGRRRVAWFSPFAESVWSRNRRAGLRRELSAVAGTRLSMFESTEHEWRVRGQERGTEVWHCMKDSIGGIDSLGPASEEARDGLSFDMLTRLGSFLRERSLAVAMRPLFERAMQDQDIDTWVTANDECATVCRQFLARKRIALPRTLSLLSFDDTRAASVLRISSFNHNVPKLANAMISALLRPREAARTIPSSGRIEVEGFVNVRDTTGPSPRIPRGPGLEPG